MSKVKFTVSSETGRQERSGDWPGWEQDRVRNFLNPAVRSISDDGQLGQIRNTQMRLTKSRDGAGFKHKLQFWLEQNIGPARIEGGKVQFYLVNAAGADVYGTDISRTGFARVCGGWKKIGWTREDVGPDLFDVVTGFRIEGEATAKKC